MTKEVLTLAHEELKHIKTWCLRSIGIGLVNENVLSKIEEALAQPEQDADRFCDANCTWSDHHPNCKYGKPEQDGNVCARCGGIVFDPVVAQPEQEPVAWMRDDEMKAMVAVEKMAWIEGGRRDLIEDYNKPLYKRPWEDAGVPYTVVECNCSGKTTLFSPPQRRPLTDEQRMEICNAWWDGQLTASQIIDMVEAAHGIKE